MVAQEMLLLISIPSCGFISGIDVFQQFSAAVFNNCATIMIHSATQL
jgi:hypothetical protein